MKVVQRARKEGQQVFVETCPQYLILDEKEYNRPGFSGAAFVCAPPLRKKEDREALREAVAKGKVDMLGTDHCSFNMKDQKTRGKDDFTRIPGGLRGCPVAEYGKVHTELKGKYIHRTARQL